MNTKFLVLALIAAAGVSGCNKIAPPVEQDDKPVAVAKVQLKDTGEFPAGFEPSFGYRVRSKRTETISGEQYKKLMIEFKGGDVAATDASIEEGLKGLGYRRYKTLNQPNGAVVGDYGRDGHRITVTTTPRSQSMSLFDADANGTVYWVWKPN